MVDTIKLRLSDLEKHQAVYNHSRNNKDVITFDYVPKKKIHGQDVESWGSDKGERMLQYGSLIEHAEVEYSETTNKVERFKSHNRWNPSSHYAVRSFVNKSRDCIVWEFSIPKYFYGTNIIQAVQNPLERDFIFARDITDTLAYQRRNFFYRLIAYIEAFFKKEYAGIRIDYNCLEIIQIDLCFNQIFYNKRESLQYLNLQKQVKCRGERAGQDRFRDYETSIFFGCKAYKKVVYHKGAEYERNDRKKHEQINRKFKAAGRKAVFDVDFLQELADRTLRYEVSIRPDKMIYLFNEKCFRSGSESYQLMKELFNKLRGRKDRDQFHTYDDVHDILIQYKHKAINGLKGMNLIEFLCSYFPSAGRNFDEVPTDKDVFDSMKTFVKQMDLLTNFRRQFYFNMDDESKQVAHVDRTSNITMFETMRYHLFDNKLFKACFDFFLEFVNELKIEQKTNLNEYMERVDKYNAKVERERFLAKSVGRKFTKSKLDRTRMVMLLGFAENYSLDQMKKMMSPELDESQEWAQGLSDAQYLKECKKRKASHDRLYRKYESELKLLGFTRNSLNEGKEINAPLTFFDYYNILNMNLGRWNITNTPYTVFSK